MAANATGRPRRTATRFTKIKYLNAWSQALLCPGCCPHNDYNSAVYDIIYAIGGSAVQQGIVPASERTQKNAQKINKFGEPQI